MNCCIGIWNCLVLLHAYTLLTRQNTRPVLHVHNILHFHVILIQWKLLIMITLGPALFDNNNRLITLRGEYKNLHYLTQFIVTTFYMYKKQQNLL